MKIQIRNLEKLVYMFAMPKYYQLQRECQLFGIIQFMPLRKI
jgi:hypothetical protein